MIAAMVFVFRLAAALYHAHTDGRIAANRTHRDGKRLLDQHGMGVYGQVAERQEQRT